MSISPKLQNFISELINHFECSLISYIFHLQNVETNEKSSFVAGHNVHLVPSAALANAVKRLTTLANLFHPVDNPSKKNKAAVGQRASSWIADIQRYSMKKQAPRILVHVGLDLYYSFEKIFEESADELVEIYAINAAEMILKYFASPIHSKKINFDAPTVLKGLLECSGYNNTDTRGTPQLSLDEQSIIECCCGKLFSAIFRMDQEREKSKFGKLLSTSAVLHEGIIYEHTNRPRTESIRRLLATIETNSETNIQSALKKFEMKRPASSSDSFQFKIKMDDVWTTDNREGGLIEEIVVKLATSQNEDKVEGIKAKILEDINKIKRLYSLDVIEDLIESLGTIEDGLESDIEESDSDDEKEAKKGAKKISTIKQCKINKWNSKF